MNTSFTGVWCLTFTQREEEDVEQNTDRQGAQRHPPPKTHSSRDEHWDTAAKTTQRCVSKLAGTNTQAFWWESHDTVSWSTEAVQVSVWFVRAVSHPSRNRSTSSVSVTGSRKMAIRLKQITMFSRSKVSALGPPSSEALSMEDESLAGNWVSLARSLPVCGSSWGEEAVHCMLGDQRTSALCLSLHTRDSQQTHICGWN